LKRFPWTWLVALLAGFGLGLLYAWVIAPVRYVDTTPDTLRADFKDQFRIAIAAAYSANHNLDRARARLALLGEPDPAETLTAQAQRMLAAGESFAIVQQVAALATDLQTGVASIRPTTTTQPAVSVPPASPTGAAPPSGTETPGVIVETPTAELVSTPIVFYTPTPRPTRTPVPTAGAPFVLVGQDEVCNPNLTNGLMQISVIDRRGRQMPGVEIIITWSGGEEHFFTGLKPEIANGYADYIMQAGVTYTVRVGESGSPAPNLVAPICPDASGQTYTGGLHLTFQQP
jgi:hypothetical protein